MLTKNQTEHYQWAASVGREARDMQPIGFEDYRRAAVCILSLEAENAALREQMLAIRCNTDPSTFGTLCDLSENTAPHSYAEHLEAQLRIINKAASAALNRESRE